MKYQAAGNYLKMYRLRSGLSQGDLGKLVGYKDPCQILRHERSTSVPPLQAALTYELIFRVPAATIFAGMRDAIKRDVDRKLQEMETTLGNRSADDRDANLIAQKLMWLSERKKS